jgi:hypothetical protein
MPFYTLVQIFCTHRKFPSFLLRGLTVLLLLLLLASQAFAHDFSGYISVEGRFFPNDALFPDQRSNNASLAVQPEYYHEWENGSSFTLVPFARLDSADDERTHFDIRELNVLWVADLWELRIGIGKVFWGVTEFVHLVDIINQTDLVEAPDEEDKLGQPMVNLTFQRNWGTIDLFVLPYFRERTFPGREGRLRTSPVVDTENVIYESGQEEHHVDFAARYSHSIGNWDFGIYNFAGTGREPTLLLKFINPVQPVLIPFYEQINQTGIDVQMVAGEWLWKLEALYRTGQGKDFFSAVGGFEYTFTGVAGTRMDLGVIGEWAFDDRGDEAATPFENDIMFGLRIGVNDAATTELLAGFSQDVDSSARVVSIEASRRFGDRIKMTIEAGAFFDQPEDDLLFSLGNDDFIRLELAYYF